MVCFLDKQRSLKNIPKFIEIGAPLSVGIQNGTSLLAGCLCMGETPCLRSWVLHGIAPKVRTLQESQNEESVGTSWESHQKPAKNDQLSEFLGATGRRKTSEKDQRESQITPVSARRTFSGNVKVLRFSKAKDIENHEKNYAKWPGNSFFIIHFEPPKPNHSKHSKTLTKVWKTLEKYGKKYITIK